jgi:hypothetical protein
MRYLYGDSSESTLEINYLAFLRDAIDFGVAVLQAEHGLVQARERKGNRDRSAEEQARAIEQFGRVALAAVDPYAQGDAPVNRCAASVSASISDAIKREIQKVRSGQGTDSDQIVGELQRLREKCVSALGAMLATHDLPDADETLVVQWGGTAYEARMVQRVGWGLEVTMTLDIPPSSLFGHDLRVEKVADGAEVHAPETAGWLKKEVKMVPHKLGRYHVTHVTVATNGVVLRVRATPEAGAAGFDISVGRRGDVTVERAGRNENEATFDTDERDLGGLRALAAKLEAAVDALHGSRGGLVSAVLDGKALAAHEHPAVMVERLVAAMAPTVAEITRHSLSPRELVIKRLLGGDRREEIFLSRAELAAKVHTLPPQQQRLFVPLGIVEPITIESKDVEIDVDDLPARPMPAMGTKRPTSPPPAMIEAEAPPAKEPVAPPVPSVTGSTSTSPPNAPTLIEAMEVTGATVHGTTVSGAPVHPPVVHSRAVTPSPVPQEPEVEVDTGPAIMLEAELPPVRVRPGSLPPLPPLSGASAPPPRDRGKTAPPPMKTAPPPPPSGPSTSPTPPAPPIPPPGPPAPPAPSTPMSRLAIAAAEAAVDAALRDLEDGEPTQVISGAPRPGQ